MTKKRLWTSALLMLACVAINLAGKRFAAALELPVWMDAFGTALAAYALGPACGAVVGGAVNILSSLAQPMYMVYALTSVAVGVIVGYCARKKLLEDLFGILTTGFLVTIASVALSTPLNVLFFDGYTGNKWGDGVIDLLAGWDFPGWVRCTVGEFYVDFVDKVLALICLCGLVRLVRRLRKGKGPGKGPVCLILAALVLSAAVRPLMTASAAEPSTDYNTCLQTVYNNENGLPGGTANDIALTADGALWVGTYGGLYRYNGSEFQWMNEFDSIKNVNCFYTDDQGRLWIGTNDSGLSVCADGAIARVLDEDKGLPSNSVRCITQGPGGSYYIGTTDALAIVDRDLTVRARFPEIVYVWSLAADETGYAAAVTDEGSLYLLRNAEFLARLDCDGPTENFTCCTFGADGFLYAGTSGNRIQVYRVGPEGLTLKRTVACGDLSYLNDLCFAPDGGLIICAYNGIGWLDAGGALHRMNAKTFSTSVGHVIFDYQGNLWFTSSRLGLLKLCRSPFTELYSNVGLPGRVVNTVTKWRGDFYFGTDSGLDAADGGLSQSLDNDLTQALKGVRIRCLMADSKDHLWVCTSGQGVWNADTAGNIQVYDSAAGALGEWFRSALEFSDGTVVLAGDSGLSFVTDGRVVRTIGSEDGLENPKVLCMLELPDGALLAGTDGGGIAVIRNGRVERILRKEDGLSSKIILRMVRDPKGEGTFIVTSNSLCFLEDGGEIRVLSNFPYFNNYDVSAGPDGKLFVPGSAGVYVVDRDALLRGESLEYTLLNTKKGLRATLTANSWNYAEGNTLYLSGDNGVTAVDLSHYDDTDRTYRMNLKGLTVDGEDYPVQSDRTTVIPRGARRVTLSPEIMNYSTSDPHVSLFLEGFDAEPRVCLLSEMGDAVYTNLPVGQYTFHIAILDDEGAVHSERTFTFEKEKAIYDEAWFLFYVGFVFVLTIFYLAWMLFRTQIQRTLNFQKRELALAKKQVEMGNEAILTIARTVDAKDVSTSEHSFRVSEYSVMIARRLGLSPEACEELRRTALLHDIGKIGIPDSILNKPGKLTDEEYAIMKSHVDKGARILQDFTSVDYVVEGAQYHHERYDGKGYAKGLKGEEIPLYARIIGTADAFDAMTANRVYRSKLPFDYVLGELERGRGTQFDPHLVDILLELIDDGTIQVDKLYVDDSAPAAEGEK